MTALIDCLRDGVPEVVVELRRLGRTLNQRAGDVLTYLDRPGTSTGPIEALNGRPEHLRGFALGGEPPTMERPVSPFSGQTQPSAPTAAMEPSWPHPDQVRSRGTTNLTIYVGALRMAASVCA